MGPGITIDEAIDLGSSEPVLVNGWVRAEDGDIRFCDAVAESYPLQCVGTSLVVEGSSWPRWMVSRADRASPGRSARSSWAWSRTEGSR
jgi:hypothetical protein